ncbi:DUF3592 domain-containing protein [Cytophaga aurantiaca]|uniref:DUF3592 domain-containing protein n=1 Tax=Cytophaga aurantiaca TaxID=29530 RepID=UPI00036A77E2|nr:DUF3592 domain-containing protein [Cytophaga aurantiaca]
MNTEVTSNSDNSNDQKKGGKFGDLKKHKLGLGCMVLFFLPFVIGGFGSLFFVTYKFYKVSEAKNWKPTHANMLFAEQYSSNGRNGSARYDVNVKYEYFVGAKFFIGNSVSFYSGKNNLEKYGALYDSLYSAKVVEVYVNENDPSESVVIRDVTNSMIGLVVFSLMLNALLMVFLLPHFFKQLTAKKILVFTCIIWALGISKMIFHIGDIDISKKVVVIEKKEE